METPMDCRGERVRATTDRVCVLSRFEQKVEFRELFVALPDRASGPLNFDKDESFERSGAA